MGLIYISGIGAPLTGSRRGGAIRWRTTGGSQTWVEAMGSHDLSKLDVPCPPGMPAPVPETDATELLARVLELSTRLEQVGQELIEAKRVEEELRLRNAELAHSNMELDRFAAQVAHDLKSHLFSLSGCAVQLKEALGENPSGQVQEMIGYIKDSAQQLARLVRTLWQYSRAGHGQIRLDSCEMRCILDKVLAGLKADLEAKKAWVTCGPLPTVHGNAELLGELLQNLIENAIKYCDGREPRIHVAAREEPDHWLFSVRDNGRGIAPEHFERVFHVFERVEPDNSNSPGLGLGLATCKRIVEKHGGRIWVNSVLGEGSIFFFTLRK